MFGGGYGLYWITTLCFAWSCQYWQCSHSHVCLQTLSDWMSSALTKSRLQEGATSQLGSDPPPSLTTSHSQPAPASQKQRKLIHRQKSKETVGNSNTRSSSKTSVTPLTAGKQNVSVLPVSKAIHIYLYMWATLYQSRVFGKGRQPWSTCTLY